MKRLNLQLRQRALSLIELLVVISLVALLLAILLPALENARVAGRKTKALANGRSIVQGLHLYAADHRESLPWCRQAWWGHPWTAVLYHRNYVSSVDLFWSPARQPQLQVHRTGMMSSVNHHYWFYTGYAANRMGVMSHEVTTGSPPMTPPSGEVFPPRHVDGSGVTTGSLAPTVAQPSRLLLLTEATRNDFVVPQYDGHYTVGPWTTAFADPQDRLFTYSDRALANYLDGSGKILPSTELGWNATSAYTGTWRYTGSVLFADYPWCDRRF